MPNIATPTVEDIADTALIVRTVKFTAASTISVGSFFKCDASGGAFAVTLPPAANNSGRILIIKKTDSSVNNVTVTRAGSDTIDGATTFVLSNQYEYVILINDDDGGVWNVIGSG